MLSDRFPQRIVRFLEEGSLSEPAAGRPIAFVHINKTAGTTFSRYLADHFENPTAIAPPFYGNFDELGLHDPDRKLFQGHFTFAQFFERRPDALFITFLRDPIQRVVSQYRSLHNPANLGDGWDKVLPPHARKAMQFAQQANFEQFVLSDDPFIVGHLRDLQTRCLSSFPNPADDRFVSSAMHNLEHHMLFFGTTESFAESIQLFQYQMGSQRPYMADEHCRNVSQPYPIEMSDQALERVNALVQNDLALYQHGISLLKKRFDVLTQFDNDVDARRAA